VEHRPIIGPSNDGNPDISPRAELIRERLYSALSNVEQAPEKPPAARRDEAVTERDIRALINFRRTRDRFFGSDLFADPAWDILLQLFASHLSQHRITISNLCLDAAVPSTTALRWINQLEKMGFIERRQDSTDGRRYFVSLTIPARESMDAYFRTVPVGISVI
jgi:DNA-binding MarR family transcriptional regulator